MGDNWLQEAIEHQRAGLSARLALPLARIAQASASAWCDNPDALDRALADGLDAVSPCNLLYAVDTAGRQLSANVSPGREDMSVRGQNLANRPYLVSAVPCSGFLLSDVYISRVTARPCVTAVQAVTQMGQVVGFVAADFVLRDLPLIAAPARGKAGWRQIKGDPAIRETVFNQQRITSEMDRHMPDVIAIMDELLGERGVFHAKLHFSSSRATLWLTDDPYRYRVHVLREITDGARLPAPAVLRNGGGGARPDQDGLRALRAAAHRGRYLLPARRLAQPHQRHGRAHLLLRRFALPAGGRIPGQGRALLVRRVKGALRAFSCLSAPPLSF
jgi:hypothetical protein